MKAFYRFTYDDSLEDNEDIEVYRKIEHALEQYEKLPGLVNVSEFKNYFALAEYVKKYVEITGGCTVKCHLQNVSKNSGCIEIKGKMIPFLSIEIFERMSKCASSVEVLVCSDGDVSLVFGFNRLVTVMKG